MKLENYTYIHFELRSRIDEQMMRAQKPKAPGYNHPCGDLLERGRRREYLDTCVPLYRASVEGDLEGAKVILEGREHLVRYSITENKETPLHIAVAARSTDFVRYLVEMMIKDDLELQNKEGNTAFCLAAIAGHVEMSKIMIEKNREVLTIHGCDNMMPLYLAASYGQYYMVTYLYDHFRQMANDGWTDDDRNNVFLKCVEAGFFDVALNILNDNKETQLPLENTIYDVLDTLARKPHAFDDKRLSILQRIIHSSSLPKESDATKLLREIWKKVVEKPKDEIDVILRGPMINIDGKDKYPSRILFVAAEMGNAKFLIELVREDPGLVWTRNDDGQSIFHVAVFHRHESIFKILYEIGSTRERVTQITDKEGNNMLHSAAMNPGKCPHERMIGPAFQLQYELLWFKEVKAIIPPHFRDMKNSLGLTPYRLFTHNHKNLVAEGEMWIKGTINQSMVAATLMSTIGFSVAFTVPGGYNQNTGYPMFHRKKVFLVFVVLTAMSFISSSVSILMFLSLMVSSYDQDDFLESLPRRLMVGQATLFQSIYTTMIAFIVSFFVQYHNRLPIIIGVLVSVPIIILSLDHLPYMMVISRSKNLFKPERDMLYYQNPRF